MSGDGPAELWAALECPTCAGALVRDEARLQCSADTGHQFPIVDGIPVLIEQSLLTSSDQYDHQRSYFDAEFKDYQSYKLENWRRSYIDRIVAASALGGPDAPLIDVGVGGSGYTVIESARAGAIAAGCDLSLEGLRSARRFAISEGCADRVLFVCASAERLPFKDGTFGAALSVAVFEHVPNDGAAIKEFARVLRSGSHAFVTVPHRMRHFSPLWWPVNRRHDRKLGHLRRYDSDTLGSVLTAAGMDTIEVQHSGRIFKAIQILGGRLAPSIGSGALWWTLERRDLARPAKRRGAMQLSVVARRD